MQEETANNGDVKCINCTAVIDQLSSAFMMQRLAVTRNTREERVKQRLCDEECPIDGPRSKGGKRFRVYEVTKMLDEADICLRFSW